MEAHEIKAIAAATEAAMRKLSEDVAGYTKKASDEIKAVGAITAETSGKLGEVMAQGMKLGEDLKETKERLQALEQAGAKRFEREAADESPGLIVTSSAEFKAALGQSSMRPVQVKSFHKATVVNASGQNQPLVAAQRVPGILAPGLRPLTLRDMLPVIRTSSNLIEFCKENTADMQAEPQYSSPTKETALKKEAAITFTQEHEAVTTVAHWIPASRQVLSDAPMLEGYINSRLVYGLKLEEDVQLLNGDGAGANLNGLLTQADSYDTGVSGENDTRIDTVLRAMTQVALTYFSPTGIVINPMDWQEILLTKDANGNYIFGDPQGTTAPQMWGLPVNSTAAISEGDFLVGAFLQGAAIYDREDATVRVAEQHANFFVKNMVAILAEERLALVVYRPASFVTGSFAS